MKNSSTKLARATEEARLEFFLCAALRETAPFGRAPLWRYLCQSFPDPNELEGAVELLVLIAAGRLAVAVDQDGGIALIRPETERADA